MRLPQAAPLALALLAVASPAYARALDPALGYPTLEGVNASLRETAARFPTIARVVDLTALLGAPPTVEGRHLLALKLSGAVDADEDEPAVLITAGLHAREVAAPQLALQVIARLTAGYGVDPALTALVDDHALWIVPVANPDGYSYVLGQDASWRKNRRGFGAGVGVDLNRNFPFGWQAPCAGSDDPREAIYKGPAPGSEAETITLMSLWERARFAKALDVHAFGRHVVFGDGCLESPLFDFQVVTAQALAEPAGLGVRTASGTGEIHQFGTARHGALAALVEVGDSFAPPLAQARAEAAAIWPTVRALLLRPTSLTGLVRDRCTGRPLAANLRLVDLPFTQGERHASDPRFGRYRLFAPPGVYNIAVEAEGFEPQTFTVTLDEVHTRVHDVALEPTGGCAESRADRLAPAEPFDATGCQCAQGRGRAPLWWVVLLVLLVVRRRPGAW